MQRGFKLLHLRVKSMTCVIWFISYLHPDVSSQELNILRPHANFRLWLTAEVHPKFPPILLQSSLKITYEVDVTHKPTLTSKVINLLVVQNACVSFSTPYNVEAHAAAHSLCFSDAYLSAQCVLDGSHAHGVSGSSSQACHTNSSRLPVWFHLNIYFQWNMEDHLKYKAKQNVVK